MNRKTLHLRVNPRGGWDVTLTPARDLAHFAERDAALAFARHKAQTQQLDLVVHDAQGAVVATEVHDPDLRAPATPPSGPQTAGNGGR
jgi:urease beta subunit